MASDAGYTAAPTISFSGNPSPVQATATVTVSIAGTVSTISIGNSGFGYLTAPTVTIAGPGGADEQFRALGFATPSPRFELRRDPMQFAAHSFSGGLRGPLSAGFAAGRVARICPGARDGGGRRGATGPAALMLTTLAVEDCDWESRLPRR